ncbi:MAG TPA: M14 family zinc carboxypeptidase, partial [Acidimicrobiia bacterium]|nr:M14 family zinc carboxypeptidase [Acidimicrobiia bacterium]
MRRSIRWGAAVLALAAGAGLAVPTGRAAGDGGSAGPALDLYRITASPAAVDRLERDGFDVAATRPDGTTEVVLGPGELARLKAAGFRPTRWRDGEGRSVADLARAQAAGSGYRVWKRWDGPEGLRAEMDALAAIHPNLMQTQVIGHSVQGREIVAARLTAGAPEVADGTRPAVLYIGLQHAREWISGELPRRLMLSLLGGYGVDPETTKLLDTTEL